MLIGEAPGYHENQQGRPFVGQAGQFLDELLGVAGLKRSDVFITNVVKCRPPGNRDPQPDEIAACSDYLSRQTAAMKPRVIVTLGRYSLGRFLPGQPISRIHGVPRKSGRSRSSRCTTRPRRCTSRPCARRCSRTWPSCPASWPS